MLTFYTLTLCREGSYFLYIHEEIGGGGEEHELCLFEPTDDSRSYKTRWRVISSTSGCVGLEYFDNYMASCNSTPQQIIETLLCKRSGQLTWSSTPIVI